MRLTLQTRFTLQTLILVLLTIITLSAILILLFNHSSVRISEMSAQSMRETLTERVVARGRSIAAALATDVELASKRYDMESLYVQLQRALNEDNIEYAFVFDKNQRIVHDGSRNIDRFGEPLSSVIVGQPKNDIANDVLLHDNGVGVISQFDNDRGGVIVGLSLDQVNQETTSIIDRARSMLNADSERLAYSVMVAVGVFSLLSIALATWLAKSIAEPIRKLATYAGEVGKGNYDAAMPIKRADELGDLARSLRQMSDDLQVASGEVHYLAYHDSLTKLPNRAQLKEALLRAVSRAKRAENCAALLFIDLDDFKRVNDTLGHDAGDTLLKEFADRLALSIRIEDEITAASALDDSEDVIARLGGDEFTVVLDSISEPSDVIAVAQRILNSLKNPFVITGQEVVVGASIGITTYPADGDDVETLLRNADVAMYQAKERGKNQFEFYNDSMHRMATERLSLEADLRHALQYDQMRLVYQPVLDVKTNKVVAIDSKVRWMHPALGVILPEVFLPLAEQTGFIVELDEWVVKSVCRDLKMLQKRGFTRQKVSAKLSSVHFRDHAIDKVVKDALAGNQLKAESLCLKIDEKTIMRNFPRASAILNDLRESGVSIFVDGFGSGHSPLNYLTKLPVDGLKVTHEYIRQVTHGEHEKAIVAIVVAMAHSLDLSVIADGVESKEQMEIVQHIACDLVQGSYHSRAMLRDDLITYLEKVVPGGTGRPDDFSGSSVAVLNS